MLCRRIDILGMTPRLGYIYTDNRGAISYQFKHSPFEVGLTNVF